MHSPSLVLGRSFLPGQLNNVTSFVSRAASAIKRNPDVAAEITLAATEHLLENFRTPAELHTALSQLVSESCKARDESTHA
jgi:hypothetical protein